MFPISKTFKNNIVIYTYVVGWENAGIKNIISLNFLIVICIQISNKHIDYLGYSTIQSINIHKG